MKTKKLFMKILPFALALTMVLSSCAVTPKGCITLAEFNKIQMGMTYEDVQKIVGGPGKILASGAVTGYEAYVLVWDGNPYNLGSGASVVFQNNIVVAKAQFALI